MLTLKQITRRIKIKIKDIIYFLGLNQNKGVLIYLGLNNGTSFGSVFRDYKICYGFEADPELYQLLKKRFKKYKGVHIINAAVSDKDGEVSFNVSSNQGLSSSIGTFNKEWEGNKEISMIKTITVPSLNLYNFLKKKEIITIDNYISDIQGYDLNVLKTLKPFIDGKRIKKITSEVAKNKNIYDNSPDNSISGFNELLNENYEMVAKGEGILKEGDFFEVPSSWWEMDCMWKVKNN